MRPYASPPNQEPAGRSPPPQIRRKKPAENEFESPDFPQTAPVGKVHPVQSSSTCFRDTFCRRFNVPLERYEIEMLRRCLPWRARVLLPLLARCSPDFFSVDRFFVATIGRTTNADELKGELKAFREHSHNRSWLRRCLKLRLSVWRILDLADEVVPHLHAYELPRPAGSSVPWN